MLRNLRPSPIAACLCVALTGPLLYAPSANAETTPAPATGSDAAPASPADACRNDLKNFSQQMEKDGFWVAGKTVSATPWARPAMGFTKREIIGE